MLGIYIVVGIIIISVVIIVSETLVKLYSIKNSSQSNIERNEQ